MMPPEPTCSCLPCGVASACNCLKVVYASRALCGISLRFLICVEDCAKLHCERPRAPKIWIPSLMWNENIPDPVDFRGRVLDRRTGKPKDGGGEEH
eukprot:1154388-Pelagomonas_calceolata.AAC.4